MEQITIAGHPFKVPVKYEEGHELTSGEASALNQTYHENLRNNFAKKVKEGLEGGIGIEVLQQQLDAYAAEYSFGVRSGGGGASRDPVLSEAMNIARKVIRDKIKEKGGKVSSFTAEAINGAAKKLIDKDPSITELAKKRVSEQQGAAAVDLGDILSDLQEKPEAAPAEAA